jgi:hypothetical protein
VTAARAACHDPRDTTDDDYGQHRNHDTSCSTPWHGSHYRKAPQALRLQSGYFALPPFPRNQFSAYLLNQCGPPGQRARGHVDELAAQGTPQGRPRWGAWSPQGCSASTSTSRRWFRPTSSGHIRNGDPAPADLSEAEKRADEQVAFATYQRGYGVIQGTRPQTIGYSLADTPVGRAAWLLDHDATTYEHLAQLFAGHPYGAITRDDWLENVSLYWLTNTATSAARLYWQQAITGKNFYAAANVFLPAAVTVFPSPPGNNRNCFPKSRARRSAHCVEGESAGNTTHGCAVTRMPVPI